MAEDKQSGDVLSWAAGIVGGMARAALEGGEIQAAVRQGFNELGAATKAFPDSIQVEEPGAVFNPLYRNMPGEPPSHGYDGQEAAFPVLPSPSEIAQAEPSPGSLYGETRQESAASLPSPSQIASDPTPYLPQQEPGNVHVQETSRGL